MSRKIVIVVEDEPMNRLLAVDMLEEAGFEVVDFGRADEAVIFAEEQPAPIAALFTDINVPGDRDGIDLAQVFAERWPETVVVVTSGRFGDQRPKELPLGVHYISKPWRGRDVVEALRTGIATR